MLLKTERHHQDEHGQWWYHWGGMTPVRVRVTPQKCAFCDRIFLPTNHHSERCGRRCGVRSAYFNKAPSQYRGEKSKRWNGGRIVRRGYVLLYSPEHVDVKGKRRKYVLEHRIVMEKIIGRPLLPAETVHHINGNRSDNRPENLELWSKSQPYGQRVEDKLKWARDMLELYEKRHCSTCTCGTH